jgi:hypothetical protein
MAPATRAPTASRAKKPKPVPAVTPSVADLAMKQKTLDAMPELGGQGMLGPEESAWAQLLRQQHGKGERELGLTDSVRTIEVSIFMRTGLNQANMNPCEQDKWLLLPEYLRTKGLV